MTQITNSFHNTSATVRANVGETVSDATVRRVRRELCGCDGCTCGREDGSRGSHYTIEDGVIVDRKQHDAPLTLAEMREMYGKDGFGG